MYFCHQTLSFSFQYCKIRRWPTSKLFWWMVVCKIFMILRKNHPLPLVVLKSISVIARSKFRISLKYQNLCIFEYQYRLWKWGKFHVKYVGEISCEMPAGIKRNLHRWGNILCITRTCLKFWTCLFSLFTLLKCVHSNLRGIFLWNTSCLLDSLAFHMKFPPSVRLC